MTLKEEAERIVISLANGTIHVKSFEEATVIVHAALLSIVGKRLIELRNDIQNLDAKTRELIEDTLNGK